jgi:putative membrane protein
MFFEPGFFGTRAALYLDVVTLYFALLPFLLFYSIRFAMKGNFEWHYKSQLAIFIFSVIMVVVFEIGVRLSGGFAEFVKESRFSYGFMVGFLIFHILVSLAAVGGWVTLIYHSVKKYKNEGRSAAFSAMHKMASRWVFAGIVATSLTGCMVYGFLFI